MAEVKPQMDEYWIARVQYFPLHEPEVVIVKIYYAWKDGGIQFVPFGCDEGGPIWAQSCVSFEMLERIEVEKYL